MRLYRFIKTYPRFAATDCDKPARSLEQHWRPFVETPKAAKKYKQQHIEIGLLTPFSNYCQHILEAMAEYEEINRK